MKVSWELVNPLCPGFYIYLPVIWSASAIGQRAAQRAVIGRGVSRQVILTPATPDGARSEVSPSTGLAWLLSCIIIITGYCVNWLGQLWLTWSTHLSWDCVWYQHTHHHHQTPQCSQDPQHHCLHWWCLDTGVGALWPWSITSLVSTVWWPVSDEKIIFIFSAPTMS